MREARRFQPTERTSGADRDPRAGAITAFQITPGYDTYASLVWYGVIVEESEA